MADTILDTDQIPFLVLALGAHCTSQEGKVESTGEVTTMRGE